MTDQKRKKPGSEMMQQMGGGAPKAVLTREVQQKIGQQLRAMYDEVVDQGVPDRFAELLRHLDDRDDSDRDDKDGQ